MGFAFSGSCQLTACEQDVLRIGNMEYCYYYGVCIEKLSLRALCVVVKAIKMLYLTLYPSKENAQHGTSGPLQRHESVRGVGGKEEQ